MEKSYSFQVIGILVIVLVTILLSSASLSAARVLNDDVSQRSFSITKPISNLALPSEKVGVACEMETNEIKPQGIGFQELRLGRRVKPLLLLNVLPKGTVPFSGPSRKINTVNN